jgi:predicted GNAT superfamily acetyltransferase
MLIRALTTHDDFKRVVDLECEIWGYSDAADAVGVPMLVVTVKRGGILLGAFDAGRMVAFVYSLPGLKRGRVMQWSHMLGVVDTYRGSGLGRTLKIEQRRVALDMGLDLIEWTYDPLQAVNAHLNFRRLGVTVDEYALNVYGDSPSPLHQGTPTDRFVVQWDIRTPRVERALGLSKGAEQIDAGLPDAPFVNVSRERDEWLEPTGADLNRPEPELRVAIPVGFTEMQLRAPGLARTWRQHTREIFTHYLARGYHVVDFELDADVLRGHYRLTRQPK